MLVAITTANVGQNPLPDFVVRLSLRAEVQRSTGRERP